MTQASLGMKSKDIQFEPVVPPHLEIILKWLQEPHMIEFWDNSEAHKKDLDLFAHGRKEPSNYFRGIFTYWIGLYQGIPFSIVLTAFVDPEDAELQPLWKEHLSSTGKTYSLDFGIGNPLLLGKGLAAPTLEAFVRFFQQTHPQADTFFIDPNESNPRAQHVYGKAGFELKGRFIGEKGFFAKEPSCLMVKKLKEI